jgi:hypothetical protein
MENNRLNRGDHMLVNKFRIRSTADPGSKRTRIPPGPNPSGAETSVVFKYPEEPEAGLHQAGSSAFLAKHYVN